LAEKTIRVNEDIVAQKVRLVDEKGNQLGIVDLKAALLRAKDVDLDIVEIAPNADPPVCRIMDYGKYLFELSKKKKKQKQIQIKEIKLRPTTDVGDYQFKLRSIIRFLEDGDKVKITVRFRGREFMHPELGTNLLKKIETDLSLVGIVEQNAKMEGKQIIMLVAPKRS
jgi:translation initiation factor IF-3